MKNIVLSIMTLQGNGAERVVLNLAEEFQRMGHKVTILCFKKHIELPVPKTISLMFFEIKYWRWIPKQLRGIIVAPIIDFFIKRKIGEPDLILSNLLPVDRILCCSKLKNVFLVNHNTMTFEYRINEGKSLKQEIKNIYKKKPVVCVSKGVLKDFKKLIDPNIKPYQIYNPINHNYIKNSSEIPIKNLYKNYIIHVGKFNRAKRQDVLIKAYSKSNKNRNLVLVGQGYEQAKCIALVKSLKIEDKVFFAGFHPNPYPLIKNADLMVLTSDFEGLSMVLLEALALQVPVVSSDCDSGPKEFLNKENLYKKSDIDELINYLNMKDYSHLKSDLPEYFKPDVIAKRYLELI